MLRELTKRHDAAKELLKLYKTLDPISIPDEGSILEKGNCRGVIVIKREKEKSSRLVPDNRNANELFSYYQFTPK